MRQERFELGGEAASISIRALFLSNGLSREAATVLLKGDRDSAERLWRRAVEVLDPARADHAAARAQLEQFLTPPKPLRVKRPSP